MKKLLLTVILLSSPAHAMECDVVEGARQGRVDFKVKEFTEPNEAEHWNYLNQGMIVKEQGENLWRVLWIDGVSLPDGLVLSNCDGGME